MSLPNFYKICILNVKKHYLKLVFLTYCLLVVIVALKHESWADEAQAWLIARDTNIFDLLFKIIRYEGTPGLWHLILMVPSKLGLPFQFLSVFSAFISIISVYVFLKYSPFNLITKTLFPFTYFIFYQYAIVARSYVLVPFLLFILASFYESWEKRIFQFVILVGLLANANVHSTIISGFIFIYCCNKVIRKWHKYNKIEKSRYIFAFIIYFLTVLFVAIQAFPTKDCSFITGYTNNTLEIITNILKIISDSLISNNALSNVSFLGEYYFYAVANLISAIFISILLIWFIRNRVFLLYLLPVTAILLFFTIKYYNLWHQGILFVYLFFVLWISMIEKRHSHEETNLTKEKSVENRQKASESINIILFRGLKSDILLKIINYCIIFVCVIQIYWSICAVIFDYNNYYSSGYNVANYLIASKLQNAKLAGLGFHCVAIQPYFNKNIFYNTNIGLNKAYWFHSTENGYINKLSEVLELKPEAIIISNRTLDHKINIRIQGYKYAETFKGIIFFKTKAFEAEDYILFVRDGYKSK